MNDFYYNPWESDFLHHITQATNSIYIVTPFIKLSIVKKILTLLSNKPEVTINICTRFDKNVFIQKSSDLAVFELLRNHPLFNNRVNIFKLNKLHAKVYIIDNEVMFISSSNLSFSGLNSSYEIAVKIKDLEDIKNVMNNFIEDNLFSDRIELSEINTMNQVLDEEKIKLFKTKKIYIPQEKINEDDNFLTENKFEEEIPDESTILLTDKFLEDINSIIYKKSSISSKISEYEFDTSKKNLATKNDELTSDEKNELDKIWQEKAGKDFNKIKSHIKSFFNVYQFDEKTHENLSRIFIDNSWLNQFDKQNLILLNNDYYHTIGKLFFGFYIRLFLVKGRYFSDEKVLLYDDTFSYIIRIYPYKQILESLKLNFYLHTGEIKSSIWQDLYYRLLGFLITNMTYEAFIEIFNQFLNNIEDFAYDDYFEFNYKTRLQELTQSVYKKRPTYQKIKESGPDHDKTYLVKLLVGCKEFAEGSGKSLKDAEIKAAKNTLLDYLKDFNITVKTTKYKKIFKYKISSNRITKLSDLSELLKIKNIRLLDIALTHPSILNKQQDKRSYKKLAYLGSYLENFILALLYFELIRDFSSQEELKKFKQAYGLQKNNEHSNYFFQLNLQNYLEYVLADDITTSVKSDTIQAIIATSYIENGFEHTRKLIKKIWEKKLNSFGTITLSDLYDPKTKLHQIIQSIFKEQTKKIIQYKVFAEMRQENNTMLYIIHCLIDGKIYGEGRGSNKKEAEMAAAYNVLINEEFKLNFLINDSGDK